MQQSMAQERTLKHVTILNTYSWLNKGDTAIVLGTAQLLRQINSEITLSIVSQTPKIDRVRYQEYGIQVLGGPFGLIYEHDTPRTWRLIQFALSFAILMVGMVLARLLGRPAIRWLPGETGQLAKSLVDSSLVISCGGGFWHDSDGGRGIRLHLLQLCCPLIAGIPVICLGQSLGPFQSQWRLRWVGNFLRRTTAIVLREQESLPTARAMDIPVDKLHVSTDMAFALARRTVKTNKSPKNDRQLRIGVTARSWWFPGAPDPQQAQIQYEQALVSTLDALIERYDAQVVFLPQVIGPKNDDDRLVERQLANRLQQPSRASVLDWDMSPEELIAYISDLDLVIATRFHSAIFSMLAQVPVIAIAYEHKTTGIMGHMGLGHWVIPIEEITAAHLGQLCTEIKQQYDTVKEHLRTAIEKESKRAYDNLVVVCVKAAAGTTTTESASIGGQPVEVIADAFDT